jgi:hypothetical protein
MLRCGGRLCNANIGGRLKTESSQKTVIGVTTDAELEITDAADELYAVVLVLYVDDIACKAPFFSATSSSMSL